MMESRLAFVTQKDVTKDDGVNVSDPMVEINERIGPETHPRVRVPNHANVIRRAIYWKRRCPSIPVLLRKMDAMGAFKLLPVSVFGLPHMGRQFSHYMIL